MNNIGSLDGGVIYAIFGILAITVTAIVWLAKYLANTLSTDLKNHTKAAMKQINSNDKLSQAVDKNTKSNDEVLTFMKNLNGKLAKATIQTINEQAKSKRLSE